MRTARGIELENPRPLIDDIDGAAYLVPITANVEMIADTGRHVR
jgi:hypothetical protein